jgi:hypothetical protein
LLDQRADWAQKLLLIWALATGWMHDTLSYISWIRCIERTIRARSRTIPPNYEANLTTVWEWLPSGSPATTSGLGRTVSSTVPMREFHGWTRRRTIAV